MTLSDFLATVVALAATTAALVVLDFLLGRDTVVAEGAQFREVEPKPLDLPPI